MHIRLNATMATAILLASVAGINSWNGAIGGRQPRLDAHTSPAPLSSSGRIVLESCRQNVTIIHDVHWAAACMGNAEDDSAECTLPADRAASLNAARSTAENLCMDEAAASEHATYR